MYLPLTKKLERTIHQNARRVIKQSNLSVAGTATLERHTVRIVRENIASERMARFAAGRSLTPDDILGEYVERVASYVEHEFARVQLLECGDPGEWTRLQLGLVRRAYSMLQSFRDRTQAYAAACDFANDTCEIIFTRRYPFDVAFDAWATTILRNLILAHYTRSTDALTQSRAPDSLDASVAGENITLGDLIAHPSASQVFEQIHDRESLNQILDQLQDSHRRVIELIYFQGLSSSQVAAHLEISLQAVYNLHSRALAHLRKILATDK